MQKACHFFLGYKPSRVVLFFSIMALLCSKKKKKNPNYQLSIPLALSIKKNILIAKSMLACSALALKTYNNLYEQYLRSFCGCCDWIRFGHCGICQQQVNSTVLRSRLLSNHMAAFDLFLSIIFSIMPETFVAEPCGGLSLFNHSSCRRCDEACRFISL